MDQQRPTMHTTNSSGMKVSILNIEDDISWKGYDRQHEAQFMRRTASGNTSHGSSPPPLSRAASADSGYPQLPETPRDAFPHQHWTDPLYSPQTKRELYPLGPLKDSPTAQSPPNLFSQQQVGHFPSILPNGSMGLRSRTSLPVSGPSAAGREKKHPCRLAAQYNCTAMFTTSGHASRHAKIHDNAKKIICSHPGCLKKFTRLDNMNQHLGTHRPGGQKRKSTAGHASRASSSASSRASSMVPSREPSVAGNRASMDGFEPQNPYMSGSMGYPSPQQSFPAPQTPTFSRFPHLSPQMGMFSTPSPAKQFPSHVTSQTLASLDVLATAAEQFEKTNKII